LAYTSDSSPDEETHAGSTPVTPTHEPSHNCYNRQGCREPACVEFHREYTRRNAVMRDNPDIYGWDNPNVDASEAQEHLLFLFSRGIPADQIGKRIDRSTRSLLEIRAGRVKYIRHETHKKIMALGTHMFVPTLRAKVAYKAYLARIEKSNGLDDCPEGA
jgi:hypothetical protein